MSIAPAELGPLFRRALHDRKLVVVSNREPYEHRWGSSPGEIEVQRPAGGLTSALDPLMQTLGGTWVAWGSGEADAAVVDRDHRVQLPPESPSYTLRRVWLTQPDVQRYYLGYSNQFLWPLCHLRPALTRVRGRYWDRYRQVNRRFAEAIMEEVQGQRAAIWFQDYHLALAPRLVRARRPDLTLTHFWHIPFPPFDIFRLAPHAEYLLRGLLANDLMAFHLPQFAENFLRCAERLAGAEVDLPGRTAVLDGHACHVEAFPISIDVTQFRDAALAPDADDRIAALRARFAPAGGAVGIGVDRMDYSKGLPEKFRALDFLWERHPEFRERFTFIQIAVPSRSDIEAYDELSRRVEAQVADINARYGTPAWRPIHLLKQSFPPDQLALLYRMADVCLVGSLQDGMNLVAKEYVASQVEDRGVLVLSEFAGAAEEMQDAVLINPYDPERTGLRIRDALLLPMDERRDRLVRLRAGMGTIYEWMQAYFTRWGELAV